MGIVEILALIAIILAVVSLIPQVPGHYPLAVAVLLVAIALFVKR